jgi:hypothetical protein
MRMNIVIPFVVKLLVHPSSFVWPSTRFPCLSQIAIVFNLTLSPHIALTDQGYKYCLRVA